MDPIGRHDDALAQPTRLRLFRLLVDLRRPAGTDELATRLALHPNGVRIHLERLREAGLLTRERVRQSRGRPRDVWRVAPGAQPASEPAAPYEQLGRWLAGAVGTGAPSLRRLESAGRDIGRRLAPSGGGAGGGGSEDGSGGEAAMHAALAGLGFDPVREVDRANELTYRLGSCPYREVAAESPEVVCTLHRGITRGLLDELSPTSVLAGFVPRDPFQAGCRIELTGEIAAEGLAHAHGPA